MSEEIKNCPFCGGKAELVSNAPEFFVLCTDKKCRMDSTSHLPYKVINHWNTRPADVNASLIEALKEVIKYTDSTTITAICEEAINQASGDSK